ncbi:hypothetical protein CHI02_18745 [Niallia circulans]|uniref:CpsD/CapB family tyrosine-protein kinase n=1 Tax=Niallia circulans TaxID=1397 RepID=UPI000BA58FBF|nr:CpsD/CapB family tyrosine-protein kinase [Niallia circulans]PAE10694.1 hypothetical protein CHI02_18745 [Niallia circulans]
MSPLPKRKSKLERVSNLLSHLKPKSPIREQYHAIRASIQLAINENQIKTLAIVSGEESEGKSTFSANLAIAFAEVGKRVLLVDSNFRHPTLHTSFEENNEFGLSTILVNRDRLEECVIETPIDHLDLLTSGPVPPNPSELLGSPAMEILVSNVSHQYDMVIFDTPSLVSVADSLLLSNISDGVLMVVRSNKNNIETVEFTRDMLSNSKAIFLGAVLNDERVSKRHRKKVRIN